MTGQPLCIGFIPLVDAAALIVAVDKGFAAAEGLDVTLVREISWSHNVVILEKCKDTT